MLSKKKSAFWLPFFYAILPPSIQMLSPTEHNFKNNHLISHFSLQIHIFHLENSHTSPSSPSPKTTTLRHLTSPAYRQQLSSFVAQNILCMPVLGPYHTARMTGLHRSPLTWTPWKRIRMTPNGVTLNGLPKHLEAKEWHWSLPLKGTPD